MMQYSEGRLGRVYVIRMDEGEDLIASLQRFVEEKGIESGIIHFLGALRTGRAVTGPESPIIPPIPHFESFEGAWELFGVATVYPSGEGPKLHLHASLGKGDRTLTGCLREKARIYLIVEAVLLEVTGISGRREWDKQTELNLLTLGEKLP